MELFEYADLVNLGFDRGEHEDEVWFDRYGYPYFYLTKTLCKDLSLEWSPDDRQVILYRLKKHKILQRVAVPSWEVLLLLIDMFEK